MGNKEKRNPILEVVVSLLYSSGLYSFYCKTTAKVFVAVYAILSSVKAFDQKLSSVKNAILVNSLWIVNHMARKLEGISSISTSVHDNCFCRAWRKIADCICAHCYAYNQQSYHTGLKERNIINGLILRNVLLPIGALKRLVIMFPYLRIESFGDVANITQARNYIRIIKAFPRKRCAIWTKNIEVWHKAFMAEGGKPNNTTFVVSSPYINKPISETILESYPEIDHIFTVYTREYAKKYNIRINCGGKKCLECIKQKVNCYYRGGELFINELKK